MQVNTLKVKLNVMKRLAVENSLNLPEDVCRSHKMDHELLGLHNMVVPVELPVVPRLSNIGQIGV